MSQESNFGQSQPSNPRSAIQSQGSLNSSLNPTPPNSGSDSLSDSKEKSASLSYKPILGGSSESSNALEIQIDDKERLLRMQKSWRGMLKVVPQDGDAFYLVPKEFLDNILGSNEATTVSELVQSIGKLDCSSLVDEAGVLPEESAGPDDFTQISPELFHQIVSIFGIQGDPVIRNVVMKEDGTPELERNPPFFVVHSLIETNSPKSYGTFDRSNQQYRCAFSLSQSKTFHHLIDAIKTCMFKARNVDIRVWFIRSQNLEEIPASIPMSMFINEIDEKKLIGPSIMAQSLRSQGIMLSRFHLVAESVSKTSRKFPVDQAIANYDAPLLDPAHMLHSGGNLGLTNLGNTCYMNSALQCLVHLPEINYYFFFDLYERELNKSNPLGNKGEVAIAFSNLLHKLFDVHSTNLSYVTPREFKYTIGRYSSMFHGYQQQDSQEFLSWLLDALHEDLNRIYDKPYLEKPELRDEDVGNPTAIAELASTCWSQHKQRNDSIITDLFTGLYQSTLVCPDCSKQSVTFDPFNDLTLPLPVNKKWYHLFTIVDFSFSDLRDPILKLEVELTSSSNFEDLIKYLSDFLRVPTTDLFLIEVFRNYFYRNFQDNGSANSFLPVSELIGKDDDIIVYIIPHDPSQDLIVPLINVVRDEDKSYNMSEPFGIPLFVVLDKTSEVSSFGTVRQKVEQAVKNLSKLDMEAKFELLKGESKNKKFAPSDFPLLQDLSTTADAIMTDVSTGTERTDLEGYESDVSMANPYISASTGFQIRIYEDKPSHSKFVDNHNLDSKSVKKSRFNIPKGRPHFGNLPALVDRLPEIKRNYYHYPEYVAKKHTESTRDMEQPQTNQPDDYSPSSSEADKHDFVVVGKDTPPTAQSEEQSKETKLPDSDALPSILSDEDLESDTNWDNVNPLFASIENFTPPKSLNDNEDQLSDALSPNQGQTTDRVASHRRLVFDNSLLVIEWDPEVYNHFFNHRNHQAWRSPRAIPNVKLEENRKALNKQQKSTISLYDCFRNFSTPEVLGEHDLWYCPRCKEHKRATKTIQLWSTGDLLTIHLKRFQSARHFSDKIDMVVDFPIEGLNMSEFVSSHSLSEEPMIYDLVAVDEHYGGLGGGHYTACAKNFRDGRWYKFNDGRVSALSDPLDCVTGAAYLLFYKKRTPSVFAGGDGVETLLSNGQSTFEAKINTLKVHVDQIKKEVEAFSIQELEGGEKAQEEEPESPVELEIQESNEEEDLYADSDSNEPLLVTEPQVSASNKKSRSPMAEQTMKFEFENQRKQRLISKGSDLPRSVNINMGYSSSVSNLASPAGSTDDDIAL